MVQKLVAVVFKDGVCQYRPRGTYSLVEAVDLVSRAIAQCRDQGVSRLLIDVSGIEDLPIPSLVDRFLMAEDWAQASQSTVVVVMVAPARYIHPRKFGVKVAASFGLVCDVHATETAAMQWLLDSPVPDPSKGR
jgi:hypothetical protein